MLASLRRRVRSASFQVPSITATNPELFPLCLAQSVLLLYPASGNKPIRRGEPHPSLGKGSCPPVALRQVAPGWTVEDQPVDLARGGAAKLPTRYEPVSDARKTRRKKNTSSSPAMAGAGRRSVPPPAPVAP